MTAFVIVGLLCAALGLAIGATIWCGPGAFDDHTEDEAKPVLDEREDRL